MLKFFFFKKRFFFFFQGRNEISCIIGYYELMSVCCGGLVAVIWKGKKWRWRSLV